MRDGKSLLACGLLLFLFGLIVAPTLALTPLRTVESETAMFRTMDLNRDGRVTFAEYQAKMWSCQPGDQRCLDLARKTFQKLDINGDGLIILEEYLAPVKARGKAKPERLF
jgi:Ca2+-binding EF-hand superfamily protein